MRVRRGRVGLPQSRMMWSVGEESLGQAVAVTALAPIAGRLADQQEQQGLKAERERVEKESAERERLEREARVNNGIATSADLDQIDQEASSEIAHDPSPELARQVWVRLVASEASGPPTHDLLAVHGKGGSWSRPPRFAELSRMPAWCAPGVGRHDPNGQHDVWLDVEGSIWSPRNPRFENGGGLEHGLDKDNRGRLIDPNLTIAVPHGASLQTRRRGMYYERRIDLINGTVIDTGMEYALFNHAGGSKHADLRSAVAAILGARKSTSPLEKVDG